MDDYIRCVTTFNPGNAVRINYYAHPQYQFRYGIILRPIKRSSYDEGWFLVLVGKEQAHFHVDSLKKL